MAKHSADIVQAIVNAVDEVELDAIIQEFLDTSDNGFLSSSIQTIPIVYNPETNITTQKFWDGFAWIEIPYIYPDSYNIGVDSTASITVAEWKDLYLEEYNNEAIRSMKGIITTDTDGNILIGKDYRILIDEQFDSSISYDIPVPITVEVDNLTIDGIDYIDYPVGITRPVPYNTWKWIQYEYPAAKTFISASVSITGETIYLPFFFGYSDNGVNWTWIYADEFTGIPTETNDYDYPSNYYFFVNTTIDTHFTTVFPRARKAKYLRLYFTGESATISQTGATEYTYAYHGGNVTIANVTFQEVVEGQSIRNSSTPVLKLENRIVAAPVSDLFEDTLTTGVSPSIIFQNNYQIDVSSIVNEECRVTVLPTGVTDETLAVTIYDGSNNVVDTSSIFGLGSMQLFNRNLQVAAYENMYRKIVVQSSGGAIDFSIKYQNTRHGL